MANGANGADNGTAEATHTPIFAAAVGLVHYGARPRDRVAVHGEDGHFLGKVRQRLKGLVETFF